MFILSRFKWIQLCILMAPFIFVSSGAGADVENQAGAGENDPRNKISLFGGNTQDGSENGVSVGLEYEYALTRYFGLGGLLEYAEGDFDSWILGVPIFVHPYRGLFFLAAPGVEIEDGDTNFLLRIGVGYELEFLPRWSIAPEFNVDFSDGHTKLVYGLTLSRAF